MLHKWSQINDFDPSQVRQMSYSLQRVTSNLDNYTARGMLNAAETVRAGDIREKLVALTAGVESVIETVKQSPATAAFNNAATTNIDPFDARCYARFGEWLVGAKMDLNAQVAAFTTLRDDVDKRIEDTALAFQTKPVTRRPGLTHNLWPPR